MLAMNQPIDRRAFLTATAAGTAGLALFGCRNATAAPAEHFPYQLTDAQWHAKLPAAAYDVLRHEGTEQPFSSPLNNEHRTGIFSCRGCGQHLYSSRTKFDSGHRLAQLLGAPAERGWRRATTARSAWTGPRCTAPAAAAIRAMSSTTVPSRPASAIA